MLAMVNGDEEEDKRIATDNIDLCSVRKMILWTLVIYSIRYTQSLLFFRAMNPNTRDCVILYNTSENKEMVLRFILQI